ncbi:glutaredoxin-like protein [Rivularia sp. PCC 7116]|uniref:glutaredoxin domain-containing protein n=1 Tax=Rivularia sp. PCC 7116 TaxID=373994 RepID=UPI00029ED0E4|nr:glutaredoxin domain-containing protein [Rivularia sp. PCC 7116]AFY58809.1 glutaredoxin-like protein [Rivularia sp. PCC 7116]
MTHQVTLFSKPNCNYCVKAKAVFKRLNIDFQEYDVTANQRNADASVYLSGAATVPQIFIGNYHINGAQDLEKLEKSGRLTKLLEIKTDELLLDQISDAELNEGAKDVALCEYIPQSDVSRDKDEEILPVLHFYKELFGFLPNTFVYLHNWIEAYKLFYYCHLIWATGYIKQVLGMKNLSAIGYSTSKSHGCTYCQVHSIGISKNDEHDRDMTEESNKDIQGESIENNPLNEFEMALAKLAGDLTLNQVEEIALENIRTLGSNVLQEVDADACIEATLVFAASFGFLNVFNDLTGLEIEGDLARQVGERVDIQGGRHSIQDSNPSNLDYEIPQKGPSIEEIHAKYNAAVGDLNTYVEKEFRFFPAWIQKWSQLSQKRHAYMYAELMNERYHSLIPTELKHLMARVSAIAKNHDYLAAAEGYFAYHTATDKELAVERVRQCYLAATNRGDTSKLFNDKEKAALQFALVSAQTPLTTPLRFVEAAIKQYQPEELIHLIVVCSIASMVQRFVAAAKPEIEPVVDQFFKKYSLETDTLAARYALV